MFEVNFQAKIGLYNQPIWRIYMRKFTIAILLVCALGLSVAAGCKGESAAPATNATEVAPAANATAE